jgi:hypothetical protein
MTGHVVECPVDEVNRPRGSRGRRAADPPSQAQVGMLFAGWRGELAEGGRGQATPDSGNTGHTVPLPRQQDPQPLDG